jgi:hypothetical protein
MRAHRVQAVGAGTDRRSRFRWGRLSLFGLEPATNHSESRSAQQKTTPRRGWALTTLLTSSSQPNPVPLWQTQHTSGVNHSVSTRVVSVRLYCSNAWLVGADHNVCRIRLFPRRCAADRHRALLGWDLGACRAPREGLKPRPKGARCSAPVTARLAKSRYEERLVGGGLAMTGISHPWPWLLLVVGTAMLVATHFV